MYKIGDKVHFTSVLKSKFEPNTLIGFRYGVITDTKLAGKACHIYDCSPDTVLYYIESDDKTHIKQEKELKILSLETELSYLLGLFFKDRPQKIILWLLHKNLLLGNVKPIDFINNNRIDKLVKFVRTKVMENYV